MHSRLVYLIDTVIIIDHLNSVSQATQWLSQLEEGEAAVSVITRAEVLTGAESAEKELIHSLLNNFECLPLGVGDADKAAELRQKHSWKLPDAFQAALAMNRDLKLVTRNTKDFREKIHPFVFVPYSL